jgi:hypothetical protein
MKNSVRMGGSAVNSTGIFIDPAFVAPQPNGLDFPENRRSPALLTRYSYAVTRQEKNLRLHVQRIRLAAALDASETLAEALADLFIVLGIHGQSLRERMLEYAGPHIPECWQETLKRGREIDSRTPLPGRSRLTLGRQGRSNFIESVRRTYEGPLASQPASQPADCM